MVQKSFFILLHLFFLYQSFTLFCTVEFTRMILKFTTVLQRTKVTEFIDLPVKSSIRFPNRSLFCIIKSTRRLQYKMHTILQNPQKIDTFPVILQLKDTILWLSTLLPIFQGQIVGKTLWKHCSQVSCCCLAEKLQLQFVFGECETSHCQLYSFPASSARHSAQAGRTDAAALSDKMTHNLPGDFLSDHF